MMLNAVASKEDQGCLSCESLDQGVSVTFHSESQAHQ
jgi:hypothetical protein